MLTKSATSQNYATSVTPSPRSRMPWRVVEVAPLANYRFSVRFVDGTTGIVDMSGLVVSPRAGVFAPLADPAYFAQLFVEGGVVTWPGELDLAPDAMYTEIQKHGEWILK